MRETRNRRRNRAIPLAESQNNWISQSRQSIITIVPKTKLERKWKSKKQPKKKLKKNRKREKERLRKMTCSKT